MGKRECVNGIYARVSVTVHVWLCKGVNIYASVSGELRECIMLHTPSTQQDMLALRETRTGIVH